MTEPDWMSRQLRAQRAGQFAPGFADRVMRRLQTVPALTLGRAMQRYFLVLVPVAMAAILALAVRNVRAANGTATPLVSALLGLPQVSLQAAYTFDAGAGGAAQ